MTKFKLGDIVNTCDKMIGKIGKISTIKFNSGSRKCYTLKGGNKCYYSFELSKTR